MEAPDYIVVGAGSAGCVVANRLSGPGGGRVLLLEAGGSARGLLHAMPLAATKLWFNPRSSWSYWSEPEPGLGGRRIPAPRGKGLGGSSAINGTVYNRGNPKDYDAWAQLGLTGWDYASLLPYFLRIEDHWRGEDAVHGAGGPVPVTPLSSRSPLTPRALAAARSMGFPITEDFIGEPEGWGLPDMNIDRRGRRVSAADAFLRPILHRDTLRVETGAQVLRVILEGRRAVGIEYLQGGERRMARASREVILCGGAFASPHLLLHSGVGPADELHAAGVEPIIDLPGVGRGLIDQPAGSFEVASKLPLTFERTLRIDRFLAALVRWGLGFGGPAAGPPVIAMANIRTVQGEGAPDVRAMLSGAAMDSRVWVPGLTRRKGYVILASFGIAHPRSRGRVTLGSGDPLDPPRILYNLLVEPEDMADLKRAYRLMRELVGQSALHDVVGALIRPVSELTGDAELEDYLRKVAGTTSHPLGTCKMGVADGAVVDGECRVRGVAGLRVVDASVFPTQISGNPHAAVMALGDRLGDLILGRPSLPARASPSIGSQA